MNIVGFKSKLITKKNLKISLVLLIMYGVWWLFFPLCKTYVNMKSHNIMTGDVYGLNDVYHPYISKITFVNGHFILFMTKPSLFEAGYRYVYFSNNGFNWEAVEKSNRGGGVVSNGENRVHDIPFEFKRKCFIYTNYIGGSYSNNCLSTWQYFGLVWPTNTWNVHMVRSSNDYTQPLKYKDKLIFVFKNNPSFFTSQLIPNHATLYATDDGINWYELRSSESVIQDLILENNLQKAPLTEDIRYDKNIMPPIAYDLPQFPQNNIKAYQVLSKINQSHHLGLELKEELSASGNGVYISIVTIKNKNDYHLLISRDGFNYQLIKMPENVTGFLMDMFFN